MLDDRNQRAAVRLIKGAATLAELEDTIATNFKARLDHHGATTDALVRGNGLRTCANCASSDPSNPKPRCYVCAGATSTITQWAPKP